MTMAPDDYIFPEFMNYEDNKSLVLNSWQKVKPKIKINLDTAQIIDEKIAAMFLAYDSGEKSKGRKLTYELYNLTNQKLR